MTTTADAQMKWLLSAEYFGSIIKQHDATTNSSQPSLASSTEESICKIAILVFTYHTIIMVQLWREYIRFI